MVRGDDDMDLPFDDQKETELAYGNFDMEDQENCETRDSDFEEYLEKKSLSDEEEENYKESAEDSEMRTKCLVNFTKSLLGRYIVLHRTICIIFTMMHLALVLFALIKMMNTGSIETEKFVCHISRPIIYIWYM